MQISRLGDIAALTTVTHSLLAGLWAASPDVMSDKVIYDSLRLLVDADEG
jgi:hypothetical protein